MAYGCSMYLRALVLHCSSPWYSRLYLLPTFSAEFFVDDVKYERYYFLGTGLGGFAAAVLVLLFSDRGDNVSARMARCSMGFIVAVVWIMAIADEVVSVLQTFGLIFGLSDAIIGLTIFAVGNSLADLVANMSVAVS